MTITSENPACPNPSCGHPASEHYVDKMLADNYADVQRLAREREKLNADRGFKMAVIAKLEA